MRYLYLDNFRGFSNTLVPIADVNFLVGENSSGKTSLLGLFRLVTSTFFWFNDEFDTEEFSFGHFRDIVSVHSADRRYFRIGMIEDDPTSQKQKKDASINAFLATYREHDGLPRISQFTTIRGSVQQTLKFRQHDVLYKTEPVKPIKSEVAKAKLIDSWVKEHRNGKSGYRKLPLPEPWGVEDKIPLMLALSALAEISRKSDGKQPEGSVYFTRPVFTPDTVWMAPIRTRPRRTYDEVRLDFSPEGSHTPYIIKKILDSKTEARRFHSFMEKVGASSGLFESVGIRRYGKGATAPFEVDVVLDDRALNLNTVGYGVSQSLPVLVEVMIRPKGTWFAIQQPEVHLHPRAQAALGDVFCELAIEESKKLLIETHSDFMIDRFRMRYRRSRRSKSRKPAAQVLFFERVKQRNTVVSLEIDERGELPRSQPASYRRFFIKEELKMLGI